MWEYNEQGSEAAKRIYTGRFNRLDTEAELFLPDKFEIKSDDTKGEYNLVVKNVQLDLGVRYICGLTQSGKKETAELVAVGMLRSVTANFTYKPRRTRELSSSLKLKC